MKVTNKLNLPEPVVEAVKYDDYDAGDADISVTSLVGPTMIRHLRKENADNITVDAADMIYVLTGKALHEVLRRANVSGIAEERLSVEFGGYKISGQFDHLSLHSDTLEDYKETSVWSVIFGNDSWEPQLNVYRYLVVKNGYPDPQQLQIVAFLRDHQKSKAKTEDNYPPFRVHVVPIKRWSLEETEAYIQARLNTHFSMPPTCTDTERWKKDDTYAVMKKGRKSALRVLASNTEAERWLKDNPSKGGTHVEHRPGKYGRCADYCEVSEFCPIWKPE